MIISKEMRNHFERNSGGVFQGIEVITDNKTGVQYIVNSRTKQGGINALLDKEGKPLLADTDSQAPFD